MSKEGSQAASVGDNNSNDSSSCCSSLVPSAGRGPLTSSSRWWLYVCLVLGLAGTLYAGPRFSEEAGWHHIGRSGLEPALRYKSFDLPFPTVQFSRRDDKCSQENILLSPGGAARDYISSVILDAEGELVWRPTGRDGQMRDLRVQEYYGEKVLTYWIGEMKGGRKEGTWYMMNNTYTVQYEIHPGGQYQDAEITDVFITPENTALLMLAKPMTADLSAIGGPLKGYLLDSIVQEVILATGQVIFEWSAAAAVPLTSTSFTLEHCDDITNAARDARCGYDSRSAFDFYHLNAVEKDKRGNFLVSGRNTDTVSYVDGETKEVLWNLGGKRNEFGSVTDGRDTMFSHQQGVRWHEPGRSLFLLHSGSGGADCDDDGGESWGMLLDLDVDARIVKLRASYEHPEYKTSSCAAELAIAKDTGTVFVGWGHKAAFSEFSIDGELLCDGVSSFPSSRVARHTWVGKPSSQPSAVMVDGSVYASWNGATEVFKWQLEVVADEDQPRPELDYSVLTSVFRDGFETEIKIPGSKTYPGMRVVARDANNDVLGVSALLGDHHPWPGTITSTGARRSLATLVAVMAYVGVAGLILAAAVAYGRWTRKRARDHAYELVPNDNDEESRRGQDGESLRERV